MRNPPVHVVAEGDLVTFIFKESSPDPKDKTKSYDRFTFDMFRIKNGKIVEHCGRSGQVDVSHVPLPKC